MGSIGRYIFRTTMGAFVIILVSLTVVLWFTQAMRDFDLITSQRQTLLVFVEITGLIIPLLVMMIAPIALVMAAAHVLNKLGSDSEIIVMNAAGVSPWRLLRPFLAAALVVSLLVSFIAAWGSPRSLRALREWAAQVRADILTNIVQPGRFTTVSGNLTFHIADRKPNGLLVGIFVDDRRDPRERATYLAEQGEIVKNDNGSFLVLEGGSIQRLEVGQRDPRIVTFDQYAFDLSKFTGGTQSIVYTAREKYLWELMWPRGRRCGLCGAAGPVSVRAQRSAGDATLSAGVHHHRVRFSRSAADHQAESRAGGLGHDRSGRAAASPRLRQHHRRRARARRPRCPVRRALRRDARRVVADLPRSRRRARGGDL